MAEDVLFFEDPTGFRKWLKHNHRKKDYQWVGFYKRHSGRASINWSESVDQALCYGWIDGLRKSIDEISYKIRFTPRKPRSHWSAVNLEKMKELKKAGLMRKPGLEAFAQRRESNSMRAAYEQKQEIKLDPKLQKTFKDNTKAWKDFQNRAPYYRRQCLWWIMSAKREETKLRRLGILIESSEKGQKIPPLRR